MPAASKKAKRCVFCDIVDGLLPAHTVWEQPHCLVFLDRSPLFHGHCLVVPRVHYATLLEVPPVEVGSLFQTAQTIAGALERSLGVEGTFVAVNNKISQSVPHLHIHVVPRRKGDGLFARGMVWKRQPYPSEEAMAEMAASIRAGL
jgi:histidine triad (HIT) family protein